ncbi:MAG TPA: hypothetical protein DCQ26_04570 [Marinilabiliales bacterium]|jgi:hypothetical protein|nr:MAG: hypothetical protein A2W95_18915 [Bacteroidetes bacterium GWA2_40_14]OFX62789.1 MAG: hypothetical protein A2W84_10770 [Bacteroidetes bacterium GWC2_40_13]OFX72130.1 MAG: hypothetical protein A2W96_00105 [Bacteroidetes bacterium GWD2_40_43]OFX92516.1 MAG: hypothetical protein A2W97_10880 [Bacteroidetes bacterium GWE2_40_63]OFY16454.1 MAG: hypothetical protein A2W88_18240 [Bacteroidetes bacterium GWF2_40_13]OFZ27195.1 MAG: hypothetical protein A2437_18805 [Bacteroidetes bacterium RIFOXYC
MLKLRLIIIVFIALFLQVSGQDTLQNLMVKLENYPLMVNKTVKDFGAIKQDSHTQFVFELINLDEKPLIIHTVSSSCGCTTPKWTKKPVRNGEVAKVKVIYDSSRAGRFDKSVFVYTNFNDQPIQLKIEGTVVTEMKENGKAQKGVTKMEVHLNQNIN